MTFHDDFRQLASRLAEADARGRPRAIHLRRAVSAAYYALFHRLIDDATSALFGRVEPVSTNNPRNTQTLRPDHVVARWFDHKQMRDVSDAFARPAGARTPLRSLLMAGQDSFVPAELETLASYVIELQIARHAADYDRSHQLNRSDVRRIISKAERACVLCDRLSTHPMYRLYLLLLLGGEKLVRARA